MSKDKEIRLAGMLHESLVNGPGIRRVLFAQICTHNCKGCFNPETHSKEGGKLIDMDKIIEDINTNPLLAGVTFSGGDPFEQADKFAYIAKSVKTKDKPKFNVWCYTGYTFEYILNHKEERKGWTELLNSIDVLVDGKFDIDKCDTTLKFKGSSNQRIIDIKKSLSEERVVTLSFNK